MTDINNIDPNVTLLRVRQLVNREGADFLAVLSKAELIDMVLCACGSLHGLKTLGGLTAKCVDALVSTAVECD